MTLAMIFPGEGSQSVGMLAALAERYQDIPATFAEASAILGFDSVPVTGNADVEPYEDAAQMREGLAKQLYSPVRWTETIRQLIDGGSSSIVECGPGKVLNGLVKRIDRNIPSVCIDTRETMITALAEYAAPPN